MKYLKKMVCLLCIVIFTLSMGCKHKTNTPENEIILYSISYEPDSLDPQIADDTSAKLIVMNIFEGLVRLDAEEKPVPGVAESWSVSEDGCIYTFYLRKNARWSNGSAVTANDFYYAVSRALSPDTGSENASVLFSIKNAESIHKGELPLSSLGVYAYDGFIIFELAYPDQDFLKSLASPAAMPCNKDFFISTGGQYGRDADKLITNGPFYIRGSGWSHSEYIFLRKNDEYVGENAPIPAGIDIMITESPENVCNEIKNGNIDCFMLPASEIQQAKQDGLNLTPFGETVWGISFNTQNEALQYEDIRYALLSAIDKGYVLSHIPEGCRITDRIIPESVKDSGKFYRSLEFSDSCIEYSEDAKEKLTRAMNEHKINVLPKLTILCTDDTATQQIVNNIIEIWNDLTGSYINKNPVSSSQLNNYIRSGEYRVVIAPLTADDSNLVSTLELFSSDSTNNAAKLSDEEYDALIHEIHSLPEQYAIKKIAEAERFLSIKGIFYPLYTEKRYYVSAKNVTGIIFHPFESGIDFFYAKKVTEQ